jgi:hypothetical protein
MGVGGDAVPGRRDDSPERARAAALLTRMTGMYATFHYEGGLQARVPEGVERACFDAWREAWTLLPDDIERGTFKALASRQGAAFETRAGDDVWVLTLEGAEPPAGATPIERWRESALFRVAASR